MSIRDDARSGLTNRGGWWERDPTTMTDFCGEPTADGDSEAMYLREWYEANRETWWQRHGPYAIGLSSDRADDFMMMLGQQAAVIAAERAKYARPPCSR